MASNTDNVFAAMPKASGALLHAPTGTALPDSAWDTPNVAFVDLGFIDEKGFTQSENRSTDKKKAFGGTVVKVLQKDYSVTLKFAFLESSNAAVLTSIYGVDNVTTSVDDEIAVQKNKLQSPHAAWILDVFDGDALNRTVVPNGQITAVDDIVKVHSDTIMYTVTIECFEDAAGNNLYEYFAPSLEAPGP